MFSRNTNTEFSRIFWPNRKCVKSSPDSDIIFSKKNRKKILSKRTNFCFRSPSIVTLLSPKRERKKKCNSLHITKEPFFRQQQAKEIVTKSPDFLLWCEKKTLVRFLCANPIGFLTYLTYFDRLKKGKFIFLYQIVVTYVLM